MNRLLQGEVGSGKTLVALRAMLRVVDSGRAGRAARADRGARPAAPPLDHRAARRPGRRRDARRCRRGHHRRAAHRLDGQGPAHRRRCSRVASGEAGIVIGTHALLEDAGPVRRPRPRGRRRAAPLRRRAAGRAHRQGRQPAARAGDDRDTDPAHGRDDRLRRPRGLHADASCPPAGRRSRPTSSPCSTSPRWIARVWERVREEVGKGHQAYVVCPRISGDELEQGETDAARPRRRRQRRHRRASPLAAVEERRRRARRRAPRGPSRRRRSTAGCRPTPRTPRCAPSPPARSTCWSPPP